MRISNMSAGEMIVARAGDATCRVRPLENDVYDRFPLADESCHCRDNLEINLDV